MTPEQAGKVAVELSQQLAALGDLQTYLEERLLVMVKRSHEQN